MALRSRIPRVLPPQSYTPALLPAYAQMKLYINLTVEKAVVKVKFDSNIARPAVRVGEPHLNLYLALLIIKTKSVRIFM